MFKFSKKRNSFYDQDLLKFYKYNIPEKSKILEINCGTGQLINDLNPKTGVGIDMSKDLIQIAKKMYSNNSHLQFYQMNAENITLKNNFDYIIASDTIGNLQDVESVMWNLSKVSNPATKIIINYQSFIWLPLLNLAVLLGLRKPSERLN